VPWVNAGICGATETPFATLTNAYTRFDLATTVPDFAVINLGGNTINNGGTWTTAATGVANAVDVIQGLGIKRIFLTTCQPLGYAITNAKETERRTYNNWVRSMMSDVTGIIDFEAILLDPTKPTDLHPKIKLADGIHYKRAGNHWIADRLPPSSTFDGVIPYSDNNPPETLLRTEVVEPGTPAAGTSVEWTTDGATLWMKDDSGQKRLIGPNAEPHSFSKGTLTVGAGTFKLPIAGGTFLIASIAAMVGTAPTGASLILDVNKNNTTIFGTQGNRPTIAAGTTTATVGANSVTTVTTGDAISIDIDQVGSTVAGADITIVIRLIRIA
jgi:hypothetical protein